jgi:hypothetical protein
VLAGRVEVAAMLLDLRRARKARGRIHWAALALGPLEPSAEVLARLQFTAEPECEMPR